MSDPKKELLDILLAKSIKTGHFILASGKESDLYCDCRVTTLDAKGANLIGQVGWQLVQDEILPKYPEAVAIGGMTMGADPISLAVGMYSAQSERPLKVFTVRKEAKDHGRGKRIEGNFESGQQIIVVDDVITTGGSTIKAIDAIEAEGGKVVAALVLVDREEGGREAIEGRGVPVYPLFTRKSIFGDK
ncbi:MAG: orotate phosphoribosyltransferase [Akkermansia sp.]|nr:orotate phosphoribosyltransferase [Akkermansia sp.]